jgi:hypothetical protein
MQPDNQQHLGLSGGQASAQLTTTTEDRIPSQPPFAASRTSDPRLHPGRGDVPELERPRENQRAALSLVYHGPAQPNITDRFGFGTSPCNFGSISSRILDVLRSRELTPASFALL